MNQSMTDYVPSFLGLALSTHRVLVHNTAESSSDPTTDESGPYTLFLHEALIAAISIAFFRWTVRMQPNEPVLLRWFFCGLLAILAYSKKSYELITAVELFSYAVTYVIPKPVAGSTASRQVLTRLLSITGGAVLSIVISHLLLTSDVAWKLARLATPSFVVKGLEYLFPVAELKAAYLMMEKLSLEPHYFHQMIQHLFFVTFHIQVGMGFLGIGFLRAEQGRRNELIRLDVEVADEKETKQSNGTNHSDSDKGSKSKRLLERSRLFQRGAAPFIFGAALPYMAQIIVYGSINQFAYVCVQDDLHRTIRFRQVFERDNHLTALANDSPTSPEAYASSMDTVMSTAYEIFNRKLFSLPKVLLLPGVMSRQPLLVAQVFPFIIVSDWVKAAAVSFMTTRIETLQKEVHDLSAIRSKIESYDIKNSELLHRSGRMATKFTERRWEHFTVKVQSRLIVTGLLTRAKGFFAFMQRNFVFTVLIDCSLGSLIAIGKILPSEIFVFSRAIEDAIDMLLMRSRGEAELARMMTEIDKLDKLDRILASAATESNLLPCSMGEKGVGNKLVLRNLHYTRGTASARADHLELSPGAYALTGSNGSGKSTLFRVLMSCSSNEKSIDLHPSINLLTPKEPLTEEDDILRERACLVSDTGDVDESCVAEMKADSRALQPDETKNVHIPRLSIMMPSPHVVEISQNFYWPLYTKPIDWIYQDLLDDNMNSVDLQTRVQRVAEELHSLQFFQSSRDGRKIAPIGLNTTESDGGTGGMSQESDATTSEATIARIMSELQEEKEDWFSNLSGGQKSKAELVRTVFLRERCPDVLLVDETMAPLDPASKQLVMTKLKLFCNDSIILVIYHTDVGQGREVEGTMVDCVPSSGFFDSNIHLDKGIVHTRPCCN